MNQNVQKRLLAVISFLLVLGFIVSIIYVHGLVLKHEQTLEQGQADIEAIKKENGLLKEQIVSLKSALKEEETKFLSQGEMIKNVQGDLDQVRGRMNDLSQETQDKIDRVAKELASVFGRMDEQKENMASVRKDAKEWQKDYVAVLSNLERKATDLNDRIKSLKADCLGKFSLLNSQVDKLNKMILVATPTEKPIIIRKRFDDFGFEDIIPAKK